MKAVVDWLLDRPASEMLQPGRYDGVAKDFVDCLSNANDCLRRIHVVRAIRALKDP